MEIFGGFVVMMSIISFFLAVVWLVMPFVVFAIKGKQDRTLDVLEAIEKRLAAIETRNLLAASECNKTDSVGSVAEPSNATPIQIEMPLTEPAVEKNGSEASSAV